MTHEERDQLLAEQGNVCKACKSSEPRGKKGWVIDHCHETGTIRGILCQTCNIALGMVEDSPDRLQALIDYLHNH